MKRVLYYGNLNQTPHNKSPVKYWKYMALYYGNLNKTPKQEPSKVLPSQTRWTICRLPGLTEP